MPPVTFSRGNRTFLNSYQNHRSLLNLLFATSLNVFFLSRSKDPTIAVFFSPKPGESLFSMRNSKDLRDLTLLQDLRDPLDDFPIVNLPNFHTYNSPNSLLCGVFHTQPSAQPCILRFCGLHGLRTLLVERVS